jgi:hypothetical protein
MGHVTTVNVALEGECEDGKEEIWRKGNYVHLPLHFRSLSHVAALG